MIEQETVLVAIADLRSQIRSGLTGLYEEEIEGAIRALTMLSVDIEEMPVACIPQDVVEAFEGGGGL